MFDRRFAEIEGTLEVHVDDEVVVLLRYGQEGLGLHDRGATDKTVDATEAGSGAFEQRLALVERADIAAGAVQVCRTGDLLVDGRPDFSCYFLVHREIGDDDLGPVLSEE